MSTAEIVRAWKDPDHRTDAQTSHPAGDLEPGVAGGNPIIIATVGLVTVSLSCWPTCNGTISGHCHWQTAGEC
jgi:hypothetical protein